MEFGILGPLEVRDAGGQTVALSGSRRCALLAILLLHADEQVSVEELAHDLWGDRRPQTALNALQVHVSHLRKVVDGALVTERGGYRLDIEPDALDAKRFERLVAEGRSSLADGHHQDASRALVEALSLWRGPALADFRDEPFAAADIVRLEELRLTALEDRIDADLALGRHAEVVPELESLVADHPLRERLRGQLMLGLYRAGRQADALEEFQGARRALVGELGIEPSVTLKALQAGILRQDPSLDRAGVSGLAPALTRTERRTVTTVCAAFTRTEGRDPEVSATAEATPIEEAYRIFERHAGFTLEAGADRVLAVFGLPLANEDDALRALRAARELSRALEGKDVAVGIGVDTGSVLARPPAPSRPGVVGDLLADVARMAYTARPGEILIGETTRSLTVHAAKLGSPRRMRGAKSVWKLLEVSAEAPVVPFRTAGPLVGRERELSELVRKFERTVRERSPTLVTISGPAGIGKSRLAAEFSARIGAEASVYVGRCLHYGDGNTFWPLAEIVEQAAGERAPGALAKLLGDELEARTIAERIATALGASEGSSGPEDTFWAVRRFLEGLARTQPVVVFFEDLHWAEPTLLDLIEHVSGLAQGRGLEVVDVELHHVALGPPELLHRLKAAVPADHAPALGLYHQGLCLTEAAEGGLDGVHVLRSMEAGVRRIEMQGVERDALDRKGCRMQEEAPLKNAWVRAEL